jgi:hypothetical protein
MSAGRSKADAVEDLIQQQNKKIEFDYDVASGKEMAARAQFFDAIRNQARLNALHYAVCEIRGMADRWEGEMHDFAALPCSVNDAIAAELRLRVNALNDFALRLLSEVDE